MNREAWLTECMEKLRPNFQGMGFELPQKIRVSCSWPSKSGLAAKKKRIGEAWSSKNSGDNSFEVFISPVLKDPIDVAAVLVHELCHCAVGLEDGHRGKFPKCAKALGLEGKMTATTPSADLRVELERITAEIGDYPHAELKHSNAPPKQGTRMLKVVCVECECIVRMTQKWLDEVGPPTCACGGQMMLDGEMPEDEVPAGEPKEAEVAAA
ncbi:MAG: transcription elongation protein SprT [Thermoguttaceae bacterium]